MANPERDAERLLDRIWILGAPTTPLPVDPIYIAQQLGVRVSSAPLEPDLAGLLVKRAGRDPEIYVNSWDGEKRQRFTCAHELGHYVKRADSGDDSDWEFVDRRDNVSRRGVALEEVYANQFAAALLMPAKAIRDKRRYMDAAELAVEFNVSLEAMNNRLKNVN